MGNFLEEIRKTLNDFNDDANRTINEIEKTEKVFDYWSDKNEENRETAQRKIKFWKRKEDNLFKNSLIIWIFMIVVTVLSWIFFDKITLLLGIDNKFVAFLIVSTIDAVANLIFAIILHIIRH